MNFIQNRTEFKKLLKKGYRQDSKGRNRATYHRGLYIFSRKKDDNIYKLGISYGATTGLYTRLSNQYKICYYKDEFWVKFFVITDTVEHTKKLEKLLLARFKNAQHATDSKEWKLISTMQHIKQQLTKILNENDDLWLGIIVLTENGWKIVRNDGNTTLKITNFNKPSSRRATQESFGLMQ